MAKTQTMTADQHSNDHTDKGQTKTARTSLWRKLLPVSILIAGLVLAWASGILDYLSFDTLRENRDILQAFVANNPVSSIAVFMVTYAIAVALSLPVGSLLTILGGFLFGTGFGTTYVVIAATIGATVVYLAARYAFYDLMHAKAGNAIRKMETGFAENAFSYLMVLRLVPLFPFWLVNLVPALLGVKFRSFVMGTAIGIIPGTFVYVSIGDGLGALFDQGKTPDLGIIFEPRILTPIIGLAILALIPVIYKKFRNRNVGTST
ncbi:TVP38/TMEM64 family protein [Thalassospira xianhensis]|uniref:Membrane protein n=1 Tax=Thalassospira xianhensis MCCC 1A02616 TaxID=1177929 RepID=A0A367U7X5_9PROT|nr:TVP38/TMEM64 family protein [Thalassospira xianhensis]RCK04406.1 membrane protein [Thalassospira xianhensis MCCC 1A02616]